MIILYLHMRKEGEAELAEYKGCVRYMDRGEKKKKSGTPCRVLMSMGKFHQ